MAYDPARVTISDWDNELVSDTKLNQMLNNIDHNYKYKPELCEDADSGILIAPGQVAFSINGASNAVSVTATFATHCDHGDPDFANTPTCIGFAVDANNQLTLGYGIASHIRLIDSTHMTVYVTFIGFSSPSGYTDFDLHFCVMGS